MHRYITHLRHIIKPLLILLITNEVGPIPFKSNSRMIRSELAQYTYRSYVSLTVIF